MLALRAGGRGDVTTSHKLWEFGNGPDVPTPVTDGTHVYVITDRGVVYCLDLKTGKTIYGPQRLEPGTYSSSPVLADGKIYIASEDGVFSVFRAGPKFELLAANQMDDYTLSSVAVKDGQLFLRTAGWLWAVGAKAAGSAGSGLWPEVQHHASAQRGHQHTGEEQRVDRALRRVQRQGRQDVDDRVPRRRRSASRRWAGRRPGTRR